ncbi:MAG: hypothetical protein R2716_04825 [Microthrixaceae bacterium]
MALVVARRTGCVGAGAGLAAALGAVVAGGGALGRARATGSRRAVLREGTACWRTGGAVVGDGRTCTIRTRGGTGAAVVVVATVLCTGEGGTVLGATAAAVCDESWR